MMFPTHMGQPPPSHPMLNNPMQAQQPHHPNPHNPHNLHPHNPHLPQQSASSGGGGGGGGSHMSASSPSSTSSTPPLNSPGSSDDTGMRGKFQQRRGGNLRVDIPESNSKNFTLPLVRHPQVC